eukprot:CAMPEP_0177739580 /NCGR_PEP_ID=MMETSP0484_2-20121128/27104_1 /TAXON_ID=354590 /ORGANISM="Rhodomonas lens, Strain RHODO" /LENGTH=63 /DNA_ID=CAMNT_0019253657 /DNA_START=247 /DNA_END=438 /DNA_ORIENTATION=+
MTPMPALSDCELGRAAPFVRPKPSVPPGTCCCVASFGSMPTPLSLFGAHHDPNQSILMDCNSD